MRSTRAICRGFASLVMGAVLLAAPAFAPLAAAQSNGTAAVESQRQVLFAQMLADPSNLQVSFEYALLSAQVGDFEGAIATLERMLIYAPDNRRLQLELGVLYYRLGAADMARSYLEAASSDDASAAIRTRAQTYLARVNQIDAPVSISGSLHAGVQVQSNPNAGPDDSIVIINGVPVVLDNSLLAQAGANIFALSDFNVAYDLRNQYDLVEGNVLAYSSVFFGAPELNFNLVEAQLGPTFGLGRFNLADTRLGVYAIAGGSTLSDELFTTQLGAGIKFRTQISQDVFFDARGEYRAMNYNEPAEYPTVRLQTGDEWSGRARLTARVHPQLVLQGSAFGRRADARADFKSFTEVGAQIRAVYSTLLGDFGPFSAEAPWRFSAAAGGLVRRFDGADPNINAAEAEEDGAVWVEAGVEAPLRAGFSTFVSGRYLTQSSNYDTRDFDNATLTLGVSKRY
ncbi:MAG: tetratricopeptide repeat protein [Pseudomonadota bacterium]